jgi:hypothetical protein
VNFARDEESSGQVGAILKRVLLMSHVRAKLFQHLPAAKAIWHKCQIADDVKIIQSERT